MIKKFIVYTNQECVFGNMHWSILRLIGLSKDLEVMEIPLKHLNVYQTYECLSLRELTGHIRAVLDADLNFPIILDEDGELMDGRHRIMKAILEGKETIKAVRFNENPTPCKIDKNKDGE